VLMCLGRSAMLYGRGCNWKKGCVVYQGSLPYFNLLNIMKHSSLAFSREKKQEPWN
jgi:hypothetical protein